MADVDELLADETDTPKYTVRTIAERLVVPTATLRSWNQRYGVGPPGHRRGQHRLYSDADLDVLLRMQDLVSQGVAPRSAAQTVLRQVRRAPAASADELLRAALVLDASTLECVLDAFIYRHGVLDAWERLIRPTFAAVEARQETTGDCVDVEHVLSSAVTRSLQRRSTTPAGPASILLACTERETHTLALEALRCALAERGCPTITLGATTPSPAILDALGRLPDLSTVVFFAQTQHNADLPHAHQIGRRCARILLAGPGWKDSRLRSVPYGSILSATHYTSYIPVR